MHMNYIELIRNARIKFNSIVCFGMDPVLEKIPVSGSPYKKIITFYERILNKMLQRNVTPGAIKPNFAFYAQYGLQGIKALAALITMYKSAGFPVILDVKRSDIGTTAEAYAKESFIFFSADAVTLNPFMGYDSIQPFIKNFPDKGYYILTKTSNKSSSDVQDLSCEGKTIYEHIAYKILDWYHPGIGSVVGATFPQQLECILDIYITSGKIIPLLIPGIGTQGGSLVETLNILKRDTNINIHRINSSSAINYAYLNDKRKHYAVAAVNALSSLNDEIGNALHG